MALTRLDQSTKVPQNKLETADPFNIAQIP